MITKMMLIVKKSNGFICAVTGNTQITSRHPICAAQLTTQVYRSGLGDSSLLSNHIITLHQTLYNMREVRQCGYVRKFPESQRSGRVAQREASKCIVQMRAHVGTRSFHKRKQERIRRHLCAILRGSDAKCLRRWPHAFRQAALHSNSKQVGRLSWKQNGGFVGFLFPLLAIFISLCPFPPFIYLFFLPALRAA